MSKRRQREALRLGMRTAELMIAAPWVASHRIGRMRAAGAQPSARDRREFQRMTSEKVAAFSESWNHMAMQTLKANQQMAQAWMSAWWLPGQLPSRAAARRSVSRSATILQGSALRIFNSGLTPVHRRATANARRLGKAKPR